MTGNHELTEAARAMLAALRLARPIIQDEITVHLEGCTIGMSGRAEDIRDPEDIERHAELTAARNAIDAAITKGTEVLP